MKRQHRTALIDGDIFIYQIATMAETPIDWGDGLWTLHADANMAKVALANKIWELESTVDADDVIIALSDKENFRKDILPTYKSNRIGKRKPMLIPVLREFIAAEFETFVRPGLEGDDVLGILATWPGLKGDKVIVTGDKDMYTIPGYVYMSHKPDAGIVSNSPNEARRYHMLQTLTGDTTDGYSGCPAVGPKRAEKILAKAEEQHAEMNGPFGAVDYWPHVVEAYEKAGFSEEEALVQARVARILQASDYDFNNKEVLPWNP